MNTIYLEDSVFQTIQEHPEVKELLMELGFTPLGNPHMLQTVGRVTSLAKSIRLIGLPKEELVRALTENGYIVAEVRHESNA